MLLVGRNFACSSQPVQRLFTYWDMKRAKERISFGISSHDLPIKGFETTESSLGEIIPHL